MNIGKMGLHIASLFIDLSIYPYTID